MEAVSADPESPDAATEFPCCVMPYVFFLQLLLLMLVTSVRANIDAGEGAFGTQLDGTVVAVVAWCCVLPLLLLL